MQSLVKKTAKKDNKIQSVNTNALCCAKTTKHSPGCHN